MKEKLLFALFLLIGLMQMFGDLSGLSVLKGIGAATGASPAPKVFSAVNGLETFTSRFFIDWSDRAGESHTVEITPEVYARLEGPYNRRNIYGAALAYGPILAGHQRTREMFYSVLRYSFCGSAPLLLELGIDVTDISGPVSVRLVPKDVSTLEEGMMLSFEVHCGE
ncbi:MAG: hypothetical protein IID32_03655 [Planctomycetes bacterium]|nr:hypothetical protein [Planctomycetota bacterium]